MKLLKTFKKNILSLVLLASIAFPSLALGQATVALPPQPGHAGQFLKTDGLNLSWAAAGGGGGGSVTSVGLALPNIFNVSGSPVTTSGTLTGSFVQQAVNTIFAGPASGGSAVPTFRALVAADIPVLPYGTGTVTNIATSGSVSGGPITTTGTISLVNDNATPGNNFFYGTNGSGTKAWLPTSGILPPLALSHLYVGNVSNLPVDGGSDITWTAAQRRFTVGDPSSSSLGGYFEVDGNGGGFLGVSTINSVTDSTIFSGSSVSGTGLAVNMGDLAGVTGTGIEGLKAQVLISNNATTQNRFVVSNPVNENFLITDVANDSYGLGDLSSHGNDTRLNINDALATTRLGAAYISEQTDSMNGTVLIGDVGGQANGMTLSIDDPNQTVTLGNLGAKLSIDSANQFAQLSAASGGSNLYIDATTPVAILLAATPVGQSISFRADKSTNSFLMTGSSTYSFVDATGDITSWGYAAGASNAGGLKNSAFGFHAGQTNTTGSNNSWFGYKAGEQNIDGSDNTYIGNGAGGVDLGGSNSVMIGSGAGATNDSAGGNIFIGSGADGENSSVNSAIAIGVNAISQKKATVIGSDSMPMNYYWLGNGFSSTIPQSFVQIGLTDYLDNGSQPIDGTGSNMTFHYGNNTGAGAQGAYTFQGSSYNFATPGTDNSVNANTDIEYKQGTSFQTTDATVNVITLAQNAGQTGAHAIHLKVSAATSGGTDWGTIDIVNGYYLNGAAFSTTSPDVQILNGTTAYTTASTFAFELQDDGNGNLGAKVRGIAGTTINWTMSWEDTYASN